MGVRLDAEKYLIFAVERALAPGSEESEAAARDLRDALSRPMSPGADRPVFLALRGAAEAWAACGANHEQRPQLKVHLKFALDIARRAQSMRVTYVPRGAPRPVFEGRAK
jgi:hypothetical protein